jgi:hypothetical protein
MEIKNNLKFENEELRKIILEMFETDKSITKFRILQISGREN